MVSIGIALDFHRVYVFGDMSSNSLVRLDHVDQRDGTQHEQDHVKWAALSYTPLNVDFVCRVPIHHDLAFYQPSVVMQSNSIQYM